MAVITVIQAEWQEESDIRGIHDTGWEVTMYDIFLLALLLDALLNYPEVVLEMISHY